MAPEVLQLLIVALLFAGVALIFLEGEAMAVLAEWAKSVGWVLVGLAVGVAAGLTITELFHPGFGWTKVLG